LGVADVLHNALGNVSLSKHGCVLLTLGKVLDETTCPADSLGLATSTLGHSRSILEQFFEDADERFRVVKWGNWRGSLRHGGVLKHGSNAGLKEGKIHQTNAAEVGFLLVLGDDLAESTNNSSTAGSKGHNTLVLGRDGKVVQGETGKVASVSALLGEAVREGGENVILSGADHRNAVLFMSNVAELVDALGGVSGLLSLFFLHGGEEIRNIIHCRGTRRDGGLLITRVVGLGRGCPLGSGDIIGSGLSSGLGGLLLTE
jgi:hypothetical protein